MIGLRETTERQFGDKIFNTHTLCFNYIPRNPLLVIFLALIKKRKKSQLCENNLKELRCSKELL